MIDTPRLMELRIEVGGKKYMGSVMIAENEFGHLEGKDISLFEVEKFEDVPLFQKLRMMKAGTIEMEDVHTLK